MVRSFSFFALLSVCVSLVARCIDVVALAVERAVDFIGSPFAITPRLAYDGPAAPRVLGEGWADVTVDRHEAGTSRRSAARNI